MPICQNCGEEVKSQGGFCEKCGNSIEKAVSKEHDDNNASDERFNLSIPKKHVVLVIVLAVAIALGITLYTYVVQPGVEKGKEVASEAVEAVKESAEKAKAQKAFEEEAKEYLLEGTDSSIITIISIVPDKKARFMSKTHSPADLDKIFSEEEGIVNVAYFRTTYTYDGGGVRDWCVVFKYADGKIDSATLYEEFF